ncbi:hypothetical protein GI584_07050 [Gracilibacillus salitolerans]|uniref:Copper resistance protein D domain-containing protein n=1 Tax=Gracilibacillus salitolerans TaxID=2663022 RepID=A0A5Q2TIJ7_9BACI|nr:hypothetical protein [Gracilibacillus salitolerans]QGH33790.1 hypothetical protein GI584_07050 [Gracilibacillus salitolerans]
MMNSLLLWIHIVAGILWVGGLFFIIWGVYPATRVLPVLRQKQFLLQLMKWSHKGFSIAGITVIITGFLMGIGGTVNRWEMLFTTYYGKWWITSLVIGLCTLVWGTFIGYRAFIRMLTREIIWKMAEKGYPRLLYFSIVKVVFISSIEGLGFFILILLMVII